MVGDTVEVGEDVNEGLDALSVVDWLNAGDLETVGREVG